MKFGRIITQSKKLKTIDFIEKCETYKNDGIPTLILGKSRAKDILGSDFSIINRKVNDNIRWTFLKTEKRNEYEFDLASFNEEIIRKIKDDFNYFSINLFTSKYSTIKRILNYFNNNIKKYVYVSDKELYIFSKQGKNNVIGISFDELKYIGISKNKIINKLKANNNVILIENDNFLNFETKKAFSNINSYIPYLYFLKNQ